MPLERKSDQIVIAHLTSDPQLAEELETLLDQIVQHPTNIVLDFASVHYISSSHIAKLLKLRKLAIAGERRLILCAIDPQVWSVFTVTGLDKIYEFAETLPMALKLLSAT